MMSSEVKIIIKSSVDSDNKALLNIIKTCLERDFAFRTMFSGYSVSIDEELIDKDAKDELPENNEDRDTKLP